MQLSPNLYDKLKIQNLNQSVVPSTVMSPRTWDDIWITFMTLKYYLCTEFFRQNDKCHSDISAFVSFEERSPFHICHCQRDYGGCCTIWILNYSMYMICRKWSNLWWVLLFSPSRFGGLSWAKDILKGFGFCIGMMKPL